MKEKNRYGINKIRNYTITALGLLKIIALFISLLLLIAMPVFAVKQLVSFQGKVDKDGVLVDNGNLTVNWVRTN